MSNLTFEPTNKRYLETYMPTKRQYSYTHRKPTSRWNPETYMYDLPRGNVHTYIKSL